MRLAWCLMILVCASSAQTSVSEPLVAKTGSSGMASTSPVSPGSISTASPANLPLVPEIPPMPKGKTTLLGGTIQKVDHLRDRLVLQVFGGGRTAVLFDERTNVLREGKSGSLDDLKNGERAYVDTTLDGTAIFARNIRIAGQIPSGQSSGQIVAFRPGSRELSIRDTISPQPVKMVLASNAVIQKGDSTVQFSELRAGTLATLTFSPGSDGTPIVQHVSILATPGQDYMFAGRVEHLDLRRGLLVLVDPRDNKSYEVYFDPAARNLTRDLRQGVNATVQASFDGSRYQTHDITVNAAVAK
jgi:hypothetical protein